MNKIYKIVILIILLSLSVYSQNLDLPFENFSIDEGMPTVTNYILQDRTGYLWFATNSGLYKHDGYNFSSYKHDLDDSNSLFDNTLSTLYEDKKGIMWIGTHLGLEKFDRTKNTFIHYTPNPSGIEKDASNYVYAICEDKYGMLWVGTADGLYKFNKAAEKFTSIRYDSTDPGSISHNNFGAIYEDKEGSLWFGTGAGLDKYDFETRKFKHYLNDPNNQSELWSNSSSKYWINKIIEDDNGILWLGTNGGLVEYDPKEGTSSNYLYNSQRPRNLIISICQDFVTGSLWITNGTGLFLFDKKLKKFTQYSSEGNCVYSERSGTLWVGTDIEIKKLNRTKQPFKKYSMNEIACVVRSGKEGIVWVWTFSGFKKFDVRKEQFIPCLLNKGDRPNFLFSENEMAVVTKKGGLYIIDTLDNIKPLLADSLKDFNNSLSFACKTKRGYWFGTVTGGFYLLDSENYHINEIRNLKLSINFIYEDRLGLLWISTFMGKVFCYNPERDTLVEFSSDPKNPSSISGRLVTEIYEDTKGRLWFTTTNGLNRYDRSTNKFTHFTEKSGLSGNNVWGILEDSHGYLWINTNKGISKFDPLKNNFKNYDISYGLEPTTDVFYGFGGKTRNGEMYFPGAKGFTRFHPDSIKDNPFIPPIVITSFKKFDKPYPFSSEIHLPYYENFLSFEFAALSYISPERNLYAYKMEGLDKDWIYSGTRRYASYPNLDPGEYVFRVKGSNNDGVWNEAGTSIQIIISPPWWKTTWAYILYSILILSIIYFTWKMQVKRIRINHEFEMSRFEAQKLHEVDELKSRFFTNISHEFRTPLTLILGPVKQAMDRIKDEKTKVELSIAHKNANKLLGLVNQLLDISKLESGNMKLRTSAVNFIPLLKALTLSFASYAERKRITLSFNSADDEVIIYIDKDKIEKIITNILSNAFKFTPEGGRIEVTLSKDDKYVNTIISDTGIGIPKEKMSKIFDRFYQVDGSHTREQEGTGIGLALTKELVDLHKGKIEVASKESKGTKFIISIPLGKEHLKPEEICGEEIEYTEDKLILEPEDDIKRKEEHKIDIELFEKETLPLLLIVEDNSDVRKYIKANLTKEFRTLEAVDGEDGWNKSIEQIPDLILSDVMMPKMDGFKLCEKLKTDERTSHIPVILLTAKAAKEDKLEGFETGADDYIMKPFEPDELRARIKNLIEQRKRLNEHFQKKGMFELNQTKITSVDKKFLKKAFDLIYQNISDSSFNVEAFAENIGISRSVLHKKIVSLVGEPPVEFIRRIRLNKSLELIKRKFGNLSEIALEVGFNNPAYFSECFKNQFGITPTQYQQKITNS